VEPLPVPPPPPPPAPTGRKSALAFFGVLLALYLPGAFAQAALLPIGLAWTEIFVFLLPALVATAGSNLRAVPYLGLRAPRPSLVLLGGAAGAAGYVFAGSLVTLTQRLVPAGWLEAFDPARLFEGPRWHGWALAFVATVLAPVCEEITFRGYVQRTLALRRGPAAAILGAAFLFALLHLNPVLFPALLVLGAIFGWLAWRGGSLWPAVAAHAVNNAITSALVLTVGEVPTGEAPPAAIVARVLVFGAAALALVLLAFASAAPARPDAAAISLALRDPADPSIRFSTERVPRRFAAALVLGLGLLAAMLLAGSLAIARRSPLP
jgi:membrane protease YdiL (CAAX protease family)